MKGPDYVHNVVGCYRAAIDAALAGAELGAAELDALEARLGRSFSRGVHRRLPRGRPRRHRPFTHERRAGHQPGPRGGSRGRGGIRGGVGRLLARRRGWRHARDQVDARPDAPADVPRRWPIVPCPADVPAGGRIFVRCKRKVEEGSAVHVVRSEAVVSRVARRRGSHARCRARAGPRGAGARGRLRVALPRRGGARGHGTLLPCAPQVVFRSPCGGGAPRGRDGVRPRVRDPACGRAACPGGACRRQGVDRPRRGVSRVRRGIRRRRLPRRRPRGGRRGPCRNIGQIEIAREAGAPWEAAAPLNVWNASAARVLQDLGARRVWLPEELRAPSARRRRSARSAPPASASLVAPAPVGSTPLMVMEHCLLTAEGPCDGRARRAPAAWRPSAASASWLSSTARARAPACACAWTRRGGRACTADSPRPMFPSAHSALH